MRRWACTVTIEVELEVEAETRDDAVDIAEGQVFHAIELGEGMPVDTDCEPIDEEEEEEGWCA